MMKGSMPWFDENSMKKEHRSDEYGSVLREELKKSMEKPAEKWRPTNKVTHDTFDKVFMWGSAILAVIIVIFIGISVAHTIYLLTAK